MCNWDSTLTLFGKLNGLTLFTKSDKIEIKLIAVTINKHAVF